MALRMVRRIRSMSLAEIRRKFPQIRKLDHCRTVTYPFVLQRSESGQREGAAIVAACRRCRCILSTTL